MIRWVCLILLFLGSSALADPPAGYPLVVRGSWVDAAGTVPRVFVWSDDAGGWECSSTSSGSLLVLGAGGIVQDSVLGLTGDWSASVLGHEVCGASARFVPEFIDFGNTWYAPKIAWLWTYGFAAGCALHFSSVGVMFLWRAVGYSMMQLFSG